MGLPPAEVAYVGDRHDIDARAADEAGLRGIWIDRARRHHPRPGAGVRRITGLAELPGLLATLLQPPHLPTARPAVAGGRRFTGSDGLNRVVFVSDSRKAN